MPTIALLSWPVLAVILFARLPIVPAVLAATVVPYLFLPEAFGIGLPGLPDLDKTNAISAGLVLGLLLRGGRRTRTVEEPPTSHGAAGTIVLACIALTVGGAILTVANNGEALRFGRTVLPALRLWDAVGLIGNFALFVIPFFFARRYLATPEAHRALLRAYVAGALVYSVLMLVEIRLSPQLHNWVYGYHQHSFLQHIRDGYRPKVFLQHGIWVGFFTFMAVLAAAALWRAERSPRWLWTTIWLFGILAVSENLAALTIGILCLGLLLAVPAKGQRAFAALIAVAILLYPILRQTQVIPVDRIVAAASIVSSERAGSLEFRLRNEDAVLERAFEKPITGWGGWARERIYDAQGNDVTVSEGRWIQTLSVRGWLGYVGLFGMLTMPLLLLGAAAKRKTVPPETIALALICAGNLIYMVPNSTLTPIGWLAFGALAGFVQYDARAPAPSERAGGPDPVRGGPRYTRFPAGTAQART